MTDDEKIDEALSRGVENVFPNVEFVKSLLKKGKQFTIYMGIDPTGPTYTSVMSYQFENLRNSKNLGTGLFFLSATLPP